MGTFAKKIINVNIKNLLKLLNKAFADEWLAYYQYWIGAKVAKGPMRPTVTAELEEHALDELDHAKQIANRIIQLGGTPLLKPEDWYKHTNCGFEPPKDCDIEKILKQNIKGEQCAIKVYQKISNLVHQKDVVTYNMTNSILEDEVEHEEDLENILEDLTIMQNKFSK